MADIRINSLPSTATSFNTDDYIAIDGASAGTRRMLAANPPFSDVTLGTSGPSVKSTLSARAPRQGLVFDSSAHGGAPIANQPAFGTSDFTVTAWVNPVSVASNTYILSSVSDSASLFFAANTVQWIANASAVISVAGGVVAGKSQLFVVTRNAGTTTYYYNGVAVSTTPSGSGNLANPIVKMGSSASGASGHFNGTVSALIYNRALSASEVVALYEAGAPSGADYQSSTTPAGVNLLTAAQATFTADTYWSKTNVTVDTGAGTATLNATVGGASLAKANSMVVGKRYRVTMEVSSANTTYYVLGNGTLATFTGTGTKTAEFVADGVTLTGCYLNSGTGTVVLDSLQVTPVGLLLAPDAAQAGGGLTWYDTSGNAANITLPASGVSWNVPSSRVLGGDWTTSGNLTVSGGQIAIAALSSTPSVLITQTDSSGYSVMRLRNTGGTAQSYDFAVGGSGTGSLAQKFYIYDNTAAVVRLAIAPTTGNLLLGTTTDGGQKLQVNGTALLGTDNASLGAYFDYNGGIAGNATLWLKQTTKSSSTYTLTGGGTYTALNAPSGGSIYLRINNSDALTLDSSQNATFAGAGTFNKFVSVNFGADNCFFTGNPGQAIFFRTALDATAGTQTRNSPSAFFRGAYWDGAATANIDATIKVTASTTVANNSLDFGFTTGGGMQSLRIFQSGNATFAGSIAIGNTVNTVSPTSPNRTITMVIGGTTYYIHAKTTND